MSPSNSKPSASLFTVSIWLSGIASAAVLSVYAYLGFFSRHLADDYCITAFTRSNFFIALWDNYLKVSNRFTNFMLIALSEAISPRSVAILPALMIVLWVIGIAWFLNELSRFAGWAWRRPISLTLSLMFVFFSLLEAPNRFQILYWRSAMATHFAPLVFMPYLASFLLKTISSAGNSSISRWVYPFVFFLSFLLGGFSEPGLMILISLLALATLAAWLWMKSRARGAALTLLIGSLAGAILALLVMAFAPANSFRLGDPPPALPILLERSFRFGWDFMLNSLGTLPLPSFFSFITLLILFAGLHSSSPALTSSQRNRIWILLAAVPVISYLLIVASFAPSVYGQSFPVERARFAGQLCCVAMLMIEGAGLGILFAQWRPRTIPSLPVPAIAGFLLVLAAIYPLRAAWLALGDVPEYSARAQAWDEREATILSLRAQGQTDLTVRQFDGIYGVKELDTYASHWVNRCAAAYYDVHSIQAISVKKP